MSPIDQLKNELRAIAHLKGTISLLQWDQETQMPPGGGVARADQIALLESIAHEKFISNNIKSPLNELVDLETGKPKNELADDMPRLVNEIWKDYHRAASFPPEYVKEIARVTSLAQQVWVEARKENNFNKFSKPLQKIVELKMKEIAYLGEKDTPYDTLLDEFEPGMTSKKLTLLFDKMRIRLVPLIQKISNSNVNTHSEILLLDYDEQKQWKFGLSVLKDMGYNFQCGRQDKSAHPFTIEMHPTDVRVTTRISKNNLMWGFSSSVHEGGHGLYEQGLDSEWYGTPFCQAISYGIHESQSRLWENLVALSKPFWMYYYPKLQKLYPENLSNISLDNFYRAINTVKPSFIRVGADEATYNLHIMLRFEIEKMIINDGVSIDQLPGIWNQKMEEYLGIKPDSDANGVLQDVHWSFGGFGYFPTYALGNLYNVPIMNQIRTEISDLDDQIERGHFQGLQSWLKENIHRFGRRKSASELIMDITGKPLSADPFMDYLEKKYTELYEL